MFDISLETLNNKIKNVNIGLYLFYNTNLNHVITSINGFNDPKIPYEFYPNKNITYVFNINIIEIKC